MKRMKFLITTMIFSCFLLQASCLSQFQNKAPKEILNIDFNELYKNDSMTIVNNGQVIFSKKLETVRGGKTGYLINVFNLNKKELGFKVRLSNRRVINEPFPDTFISCPKPLNLEFFINGVRQNSVINKPEKLYLGVGKSKEKDSLYFYWSDSAFQYM